MQTPGEPMRSGRRTSRRPPELVLPLDAVGQLRLRQHGLWLEATTTPPATLRGRSTLVVVDDENLRISARDLGFVVSYERLRSVLAAATGRIAPHSFFTRGDGDVRRERYFADRGWVAHPRDALHHIRQNRVTVAGNSDHVLSYHLGVLATALQPAVVIIATGDGALANDLAAGLSELPKPPCMTGTLSLPGSTSRLLDARTNRWIAFNIEIGLDCLRPLNRTDWRP